MPADSTTEPGPRAPVLRLARAKVNLYLHVAGRRADGLHLLDSLVVFAPAADRIEVAWADRCTLSVSGPMAPALAEVPESANLAWRAAEALAHWAGVEPRAAIRLHKELPVAAGLGGGSADAAAVLHACDTLWATGAGDAVLRVLAAGLGADVPVCVMDAAALVAGTGERLSAAPPLPPLPLVLVRAPVALSTRDVFAAYAGAHAPLVPLAGWWNDIAALAAALGERRNDLEAAALALAPAVGDALALLRRRPGCLLARMSGSGPVCFGLFLSADAADAAAETIAAARPDWWVRSGVAE